MKNYKIVENRPELSKEQLSQGMDFNKVKMNAAIAKQAALKALFIKCVLGLVVISSGIVVYKITTGPGLKSNLLIIDTVGKLNAIVNDSLINSDKASNEPGMPLKNEDRKIFHISNSAFKSSIDTSTEKNIILAKNNDPEIVEERSGKMDDKRRTDSMAQLQQAKTESVKNIKVSKTALVKSCKIWYSKDFCHTPKEAKFSNSFDCSEVEFDYVDCQSINQQGTITAVWLTVTANGKETFQLESQLRNIMLVKANAKIEYPLTIKVSGGNNFFGSKFKAKKMVVHYTKQIDLFLFFKNAAIGDKIIINHLIEAVVEQ